MISKDALERYRQEYKEEREKINNEIDDSMDKFIQNLRQASDFSNPDERLKTWIDSLIKKSQNEQKYYDAERKALPFFKKIFKSKKYINSKIKENKKLSELKKLIDLKRTYKYTDEAILAFAQISSLSSALPNDIYKSIKGLKGKYVDKKYGKNGLLFQVSGKIKSLYSSFHPHGADVTDFLEKSFSNIEPDTEKFHSELMEQEQKSFNHSDFYFKYKSMLKDKDLSDDTLKEYDDLYDKYRNLSKEIFFVEKAIEQLNNLKNMHSFANKQRNTEAIIRKLKKHLAKLESAKANTIKEMNTFLGKYNIEIDTLAPAKKSESNDVQLQNEEEKKKENSPAPYSFNPQASYDNDQNKENTPARYIEFLRSFKNMPDDMKQKYMQRVSDFQKAEIIADLRSTIHSYIETSPDFSYMDIDKKSNKEVELFNELRDLAIIARGYQLEIQLSAREGRSR